MTAATPEPTQPTGRPAALVAVVVAVAAESVLLVAVAAFFGVEMLVAQARDLASAAAIGGLALLVGVFLAACARALWRRRRWARAPVITWQLLTVFGVVPSLGGQRWPIAAALLAVCVVAGGGLLLPSVVSATTDTTQPPVT